MCYLFTIQITAGFVPKIIGLGMVNIFINWFGPIVYNTDVFPCFALGDSVGANCFVESIHSTCPANLIDGLTEQLV